MQGPSCLVERKRKGSQSITNTRDCYPTQLRRNFGKVEASPLLSRATHRLTRDCEPTAYDRVANLLLLSLQYRTVSVIILCRSSRE